MKLIFILATLATMVSANMINNNITNYNNSELEFISKNKTIAIPVIETKAITADYETTKIPIVTNKTTTNKMILKCNHGYSYSYLTRYTDIWKKEFQLEEERPFKIKTYNFTDKKRFENTWCCTIIIFYYKYIEILYGRFSDFSNNAYYFDFADKPTKTNICLKHNSLLYPREIMKCCRTIDPESLTGCNFFHLKAISYNYINGRCIMLSESPLSIPGSTDMIYKPDTTPVATTDAPSTDTIKTFFAIINSPSTSTFLTTDSPFISKNKIFIIQVASIASVCLIVPCIIIVTCYKNPTKKKTKQLYNVTC